MGYQVHAGRMSAAFRHVAFVLALLLALEPSVLTLGMLEPDVALATSTRYESSDSRIVFEGPWAEYSNAAYSGGSFKYAHGLSAANIEFVGTGIDLICAKAPDQGKARIYLDGVEVDVVDLGVQAYQYQQNLWSTSGLADTTHTVRFEWTGEMGGGTNTVINLDAVDIEGELVQASEAASPVERIDATASETRIVWEGRWTDHSNAGFWGGSQRYAATVAAANIEFVGSAIDLVSGILPDCGIMRVTFDETQTTEVELGTQAYLYQRPVWSRTGLDETTHTVRIEWTGEKGTNGNYPQINLDAIDIIGELTTATASPLATTRVESTDSRIYYENPDAWWTYASGNFSGGDARYTDTLGAAVVAFEGTGIDVIGSILPDCGFVRLTLDDEEPEEFELGVQAYLFQRTIWGRTDLADGPHTLKIEWAGRKTGGSATQINFDAIDVHGTVTQASASSTPASRHEAEDNTLIAYEGVWTKQSRWAASDGYYMASNSLGAANIAFDGTDISIIAMKAPSYGIMNITVDGSETVVPVDLYYHTNGDKRTVWHVRDLPDGPHTVRLEWTGSPVGASSITLDAIDVVGTLTQALPGSNPAKRIESTHELVLKEGPWAENSRSSASGGSYSSVNASASARFCFTGTDIDLVAMKAPSFGKMDVSLDGQAPDSVDLYHHGNRDQQTVWYETGLSDDLHSVEISWTGDKHASAGAAVITLDAIDLIGDITPWQTRAGGTLSTDTTWTAYGSPYVLTETVTVPDGVRLHVEPGAIVKALNDTVGLVIEGELDARGTSELPIVFTSLSDDIGGDTNEDGPSVGSAGDWGGIQMPSADSAYLEYASVLYAGSLADAAIWIEDCAPVITESVIATSGANGIAVFGALAAPEISNSVIEWCEYDGLYYELGAGGSLTGSTVADNGWGCVSLMDTASPTIDDNTIEDNGCGIWIDDASQSVITNNRFYGNDWFAIDMEGNATLDLEGNVFSGNEYDAVGFGYEDRYVSEPLHLEDHGFPYVLYTDRYAPWTVTAAASLVIDPGVSVDFDNGWDSVRTLSIDGTLDVNGTALDPVVFERAGDATHGYSIAVNSGATADLEYLEIHDGGGVHDDLSQAAVVEITDCSPTLTSVSIEDAGTTGIEIAGASAAPALSQVDVIGSGSDGVWFHDGADGSLSGCTISGSGSRGVVLSDTSSPSISGGAILSSGTYGLYVSGLDTAGLPVSPASDTTIDGVEFSGNGGYAAGVWADADVDFSESTGSGNGIEAIQLFGQRTHTAPITYEKDPQFVYVMGPNFGIASGTDVVFAPGTVFKSAGQGLAVDGRLRAIGGVAGDVIMTSLYDDVAGDTDHSATPSAPGDWPGVSLSETALLCELTDAQVRFAETGIAVAGPSPTISDSIVSDCTLWGIDVSGWTAGPSITGCVIEDCGGGVNYNDGAFGSLTGNTIQDCDTVGISVNSLKIEPMLEGDEENAWHNAPRYELPGVGHIAHGTDPTISGNTVQRVGSFPLSIQAASNPAVSGNSFADNGHDAVFYHGNRCTWCCIHDHQHGAGDPAPSAQVADVVLDDTAQPYVLHNLGGRGLWKVGPGVVVKLGYGTANGFGYPSDSWAGDYLQIDGTAAEPVVITSFRDDSHGGDTDGVPGTSGSAGDWEYIEFGETPDEECLPYALGEDHRITHAEILYGGGDANLPALGLVQTDEWGASTTIQNVRVAHSASVGLSLDSGDWLSAGGPTYFDGDAITLTDVTVENCAAGLEYWDNAGGSASGVVVRNNTGPGIMIRSSIGRQSDPAFIGGSISGNGGVGVGTGGTRATWNPFPILDSTANPMLIGATVSGNAGGGGDFTGNGAALSGCTVTSNGAVGVRFAGGTTQLLNCDVAGHSGAGVTVAGGSATLMDCDIVSNPGVGLSVLGGDVDMSLSTVSANGGAGIEAEGGDVVASLCEIASNTNGVTVDSGADLTLSETTLTANATDGLAVDGGTVSVTDSDFVGNGRHGLYVSSGSPVVEYSRFSGSGSCHVHNAGTGTPRVNWSDLHGEFSVQKISREEGASLTNAERCYWGSASGPNPDDLTAAIADNPSTTPCSDGSGDFAEDNPQAGDDNPSNNKPILVLLLGYTDQQDDQYLGDGDYEPTSGDLPDKGKFNMLQNYLSDYYDIYLVPSVDAETAFEADVANDVILSRGDLDMNVRRLRYYFENRREEFENRDVLIVAYSMGGVIARGFLTQEDADEFPVAEGVRQRTRGLVQIGTPNSGISAHYGLDALLGILPPFDDMAAHDMSSASMDTWNLAHTNSSDYIRQIGGSGRPGAYPTSTHGDGLVSVESLRGPDSLHAMNPEGPIWLDAWHSNTMRTGVYAAIALLFDPIENPRPLGFDWLNPPLNNVIPPEREVGNHSQNVAVCGLVLGQIMDVASDGAGKTAQAQAAQQAASGETGASSSGVGVHGGEVTLSSSESASLDISLETSAVMLSAALEGPGVVTATLVDDAQSQTQMTLLDQSQDGQNTFVLGAAGLEPGDYTLQLDLTGATEQTAAVYVFEPTGSALLANQSTADVALGEAVSVTVWPDDTGQQILEAVCSLEDGTTIALHDDGEGPDAVAGDGAFSGEIAPTATGINAMSVDATLSAAGGSFGRTLDLTVAVCEASASLSGVFELDPSYTAGGLVASADLGIGLSTTSECTVTISASFDDAAGNLVAQSSETTSLAASSSTTATVKVQADGLYDDLDAAGTLMVSAVSLAVHTPQGAVVTVETTEPIGVGGLFPPSNLEVRRVSLASPTTPTSSSIVPLGGQALTTEGTITAVGLSWDGGQTWHDARPDDGAFDSKDEAYSLPCFMAEGYWQVYAAPVVDGERWPKADWADYSIMVDHTRPETTQTVVTGSFEATVSLEPTDTVSGVASTFYRVDGGETQSYVEPFSLTDSGTRIVEFWSVDRAGNREATQTVEVVVPTGGASLPTPPLGSRSDSTTFASSWFETGPVRHRTTPGWLRDDEVIPAGGLLDAEDSGTGRA